MGRRLLDIREVEIAYHLIHSISPVFILWSLTSLTSITSLQLAVIWLHPSFSQTRSTELASSSAPFCCLSTLLPQRAASTAHQRTWHAQKQHRAGACKFIAFFDATHAAGGVSKNSVRSAGKKLGARTGVSAAVFPTDTGRGVSSGTAVQSAAREHGLNASSTYRQSCNEPPATAPDTPCCRLPRTMSILEVILPSYPSRTVSDCLRGWCLCLCISNG